MMSDTTEKTETPTSGPAPARNRKRGPRMDSLRAVRRQLATVYKALAAWDPPDLRPEHKIARSRALGFLLSEIGAAVRSDEIERRIAVLEDGLRVGGLARH